MDGDSSSGSESVRANWTPPQDHFFIGLLIEHVHKGNKIGNAFKQQAWADMITQFNSKFGFKYDVDVLKNRFKWMRKQYNKIKILVDQNGFKWNEKMQMVMADEKTWDEYIKAHPKMLPYRARVLPYYEQWGIICGHYVADGRYSLSCFDVDFENEDKGMDDQARSNTDHAKIDWSQSMDQYFLQLMLDQLHKGNKVGCTFTKKAWIRMITLFNAYFGFQHSRGVLKNRYKVLRSQYTSIKILLNQKGFRWDGTEKMVLADDHVWNKYIKEHPEFQRFKNKTIPCYDDMSVICCNEASLKKRSYSKMSSKNGTPQEDIKGQANVVNKAHDEALGLRGDKNLPTTKTPRTSQLPERARGEDDGLFIAMQEMEVAVISLTKKKASNIVSMERVIKELQAISGMDDDLLLDACDFLEDERRARMFLALDSNLRKKWLVRKLQQQ
ncbi:hypothetical protein SLEP1_g5040 [Rubroshorea leprosula]|uniref:Myb/SANT-like domain-containing protein n=1 Tax=Rubroshorea leprosula TaxID=152421 RepID=A0AAV5HZI7_9ROSI|nr:hypothetical protein SLEP1_g5040 [Rubroshorea leprosula]